MSLLEVYNAEHKRILSSGAARMKANMPDLTDTEALLLNEPYAAHAAACMFPQNQVPAEVRARVDSIRRFAASHPASETALVKYTAHHRNG